MDIIDKYTYRVQWSKEDDAFIASCLEFPSLMTHGDSQFDAIDELRIVLGAVLDDISEKNKKAPSPIKERQFKGNISLRIPPETHEELFYQANEQELSLNQYITTIIEKNLYESKIGNTVSELKEIIANLSSEITSLRLINEEKYSSLYNNQSKLVEESNTAIPSLYLVDNNDEIAI